MHGPSVCRKEGLRTVSSKWERCILGVYVLEKTYDTIDRNGM